VTTGLMHPTYLPFTAEQLREHFCAVRGGDRQDVDRHLRHYRASAANAEAYLRQVHAGAPVTRSELRLGRQMEKDERFWVVCALMGLYHAGPQRAELFSALLRRAGLPPLAGFGSWPDALAGELRLFFEVNVPSPPSYKAWLRERLDERAIVPYVREAAAGTTQVEARTHVDAMLIAPETGVAVAFEAKVLSDVSCATTNDVMRNQVARNVDVLLDSNPQLLPPLSRRRPDRSCFVLLTPGTFREQDPSRFTGSRLYCWLMRAYRDPTDPLLGQHLAHRPAAALADLPRRLGWATWEDCNAVLPHVCPWLP
jgi:hypothetical protein